MGGGASDFLRRMNEQNDRMVAREAEEKAKTKMIGTDPIRTQRMEERRERLGQLRARPHSSKRPRHASPVWDTLPDNSF
jgi:hypothetical protein